MMDNSPRRSESAERITARAGVMTRRGFVKMVTFGGGAVLAVGPDALRLREAAAQDQVTLLTAKFDVRRAELDAVIDQDLIGANAYRIRQVSLEEARRRLVQVTEDARSRSETNTAALAVLEEKRTKAQLSADRARQNMESLRIVASMDGIVSVRPNNDMGEMIIIGGEAPPYRVGDSVFSGRPVVDVLDVFDPGSHGSTYGGNPLGCAIARAALAVLEDEALAARAAELGDWLMKELRKLDFPVIKEIRGRGLMVGIELTVPARATCEALKERGMLCKETHEHVIRLAPPLVVRKDELTWAVEQLRAVLRS